MNYTATEGNNKTLYLGDVDVMVKSQIGFGAGGVIRPLLEMNSGGAYVPVEINFDESQSSNYTPGSLHHIGSFYQQNPNYLGNDDGL